MAMSGGMANAANASTCTIDARVLEECRKLRFMKDPRNTAIILKINVKQMVIEVDEILEDCSIDQVGEGLPESSPRYILYSYKFVRPDGRVSFPLMFIFYSPEAVNMGLNMHYASSKPMLAQKLEISKLFDVNDSAQLNDAWLKEKLAFFR